MVQLRCIDTTVAGDKLGVLEDCVIIKIDEAAGLSIFFVASDVNFAGAAVIGAR
jgi:hypothetical protein